MAGDGPRLDRELNIWEAVGISVAVTAVVIAVIMWFVYGSDGPTAPTSLAVFLAAGAIGTLILLVVYVLASAGAIRLLFFGPQRSVAAWEIVVPVAGLVVLAYTLFRNVYPLPSGTRLVAPVVAVAWLLLALVFVLVARGVAQRAGERLTAEEGRTAAGRS